MGLPPITLGNIAKLGAVAGGTAIGGPAVGAVITGVLKSGGTLKDVAQQAADNIQVTVDPITDRVGIGTSAVVPGAFATNSPAWLKLPWYYYAAGGVILLLLLGAVFRRR